ncbi:TRAP transporter substrate-binding protein DctP [Roseovarius pacificus]|uniref:TRAP transporter substrate-binding protein n=1 Tax=Roseovarius pacificus TaxID=337701 RepID=UPI002A18E74D|nr:TRAP transporter substrate-binding protein DctP [Roseovarius pacificus]
MSALTHLKAVAMLLLVASPVSAQSVTLKFAHEAPQTAIKGQTADKFAELVAERSNGDIVVEVFPGGQLVPTKEEIRAAARGQVDFIAPFTTYYSAINPDWDIFYQPMLFDDVEEAMEVFSGSVGEKLLGTLENRGLVGLGIWHDGPVYVFTRDEPVTSADGLAGKKIRVFPSKPLESFLEKVGASPVSMPATEVYLALQQGTVDGVLTTPTYAAPAQWHEVLKGMAPTIMGVGGYGVSVSKRSWEKLTAEQQDIIRAAMTDAVAWNREQALENIEKSVTTLVRNGVVLGAMDAAAVEQWEAKALEVYAEQSNAVEEMIRSMRD